jgi:hypothetical protein
MDMVHIVNRVKINIRQNTEKKTEKRLEENIKYTKRKEIGRAHV